MLRDENNVVAVNRNRRWLATAAGTWPHRRHRVGHREETKTEMVVESYTLPSTAPTSASRTCVERVRRPEPGLLASERVKVRYWALLFPDAGNRGEASDPPNTRGDQRRRPGPHRRWGRRGWPRRLR
jgi:hypothetical protein